MSDKTQAIEAEVLERVPAGRPGAGQWLDGWSGGPGRPYLREIEPEEEAELILHVANGNSVQSWCDKPGNPNRWQLENWRRGPAHRDFHNALSYALKIQAAAVVDRAFDKANEAYDVNSASAAKAYGDLAKWLAPRIDRDTYGERIEVEHTHTSNVSHEELQVRLVEALASNPALAAAVGDRLGRPVDTPAVTVDAQPEARPPLPPTEDAGVGS